MRTEAALAAIALAARLTPDHQAAVNATLRRILDVVENPELLKQAREQIR